MNEVIPASNTELLAQILGDMQNRAYINVVRDVQKQLSESEGVIDVPILHHFAPGVYASDGMQQLEHWS